MWTKLLLCFILYPFNATTYEDPHRRVEILFLGHNSKHHDSEKLADIFTKEYFTQGINISYSTNPDDLNEENLSYYDGLILYANHDSITSSQESALLNFVKNGKGFIPLHCASHCFRNSPDVVALIGGQFSSHKYDSFPALITNNTHPVTRNISSFTTKDETYIHDKLSSDITVLTQRADGDRNEPYTWVKEFGKGRVFYTAYGHDENTFNHPAFLQLVYNGIVWAIGDKTAEQLSQTSIPALKYTEGMVPNYEKRNPAPKVQQPLSPEESMSLMQVPVGFNLQLFASEPNVVNPIFMNWDERGRLWVIETTDYPNEVTDEDAGDDRIKIVEDTDGDGKADKFTVFADSLNIPTSFVFINGGIMVSMAPSFVFLKDTDGDDKADVRKELLKGWGKFDTHAQASNLRYGLDNKIWGVVGYSGFRGKQANDSIIFSNGVFKFSPDGNNLEHLATTSNNTWGLGFSEEFDVFVSTANNTHTAFLGIPSRYAGKTNSKPIAVEKTDAHYLMHVATKNLRQVDVHGGFTAAAGHSLYTARNFPKDYWNRIAFVTEPTGRIVHRAILKQNGAGFIEDGDGWNILTSADEWAGPVQAEVGPDGALWIADWYDFIIQHNPTPSVKSSGIDAVNGKGNAYINPLRDQKRGRIYRIAYNKKDERNNLQLDITNNEKLTEALRNDNMFWRTTAQRLLVEKHDLTVLPELYKLIRNKEVDELGINAAAIHSLWTLHGLGALKGTNKDALAVAENALTHPSAGVRKAAVEVLTGSPALADRSRLNKLFADKDLRVRLAAILATIEMQPSADIAKLITSMSQQEEFEKDKWLKQALELGKRRHAPEKRMASNTKDKLSSKRKADKTIIVNVVKNVMKFDKELITAKAGSTIEIVLNNPDFMQHNLVIVKPGSANKVGAAADALAQDANGAKKNYVPDLPEVLQATPLVNPREKFTLFFKVPDTAGDYPFLCTFPGHWRIMNGVLKVTK